MQPKEIQETLKHTPGPWAISHRHSRCLVWAQPDGPQGPSVSIAQIDRCTFDGAGHLDNSAANAALIAVAPDLLAIAKRWAALDGSGWDVSRHADEKACLFADTQMTIARAEAFPSTGRTET